MIKVETKQELVKNGKIQSTYLGKPCLRDNWQYVTIFPQFEHDDEQDLAFARKHNPYARNRSKTNGEAVAVIYDKVYLDAYRDTYVLRYKRTITFQSKRQLDTYIKTYDDTLFTWTDPVTHKTELIDCEYHFYWLDHQDGSVIKREVFQNNPNKDEYEYLELVYDDEIEELVDELDLDPTLQSFNSYYSLK